MHSLAAGQFAVEDSLKEIAEGMIRLYTTHVGNSIDTMNAMH